MRLILKLVKNVSEVYLRVDKKNVSGPDSGATGTIAQSKNETYFDGT
ncbi:MAG: hypothetical protein IPF93_00030 [Saprospiraceae bacterium]|nr:hypothetical protein [Saprospiraceae bacterium]